MSHKRKDSILCFAGLIALCSVSAFGQKTDKDIEVAVTRSKKAAEIIQAVASLTVDKGIPPDIVERANMIGVVPDMLRLSMVIASGNRGHGVFSVRRDSGWGLPVFFFSGGESTDLGKIGKKHFDLVLVVVNANIDADKKDKNINDPNERPKKSEVYAYAFYDGILTALNIFPNHVFGLIKTPNVTYDDALNKKMYGAKGNDVALGKLKGTDSETKALTTGVGAFKEALNKLYPPKQNNPKD